LSVSDAQKIVDNLEARRADNAAQAAADQREIESIALAAHCGDQKAQNKLEQLKDRAIRREADLRSLDAAITAAKRNVESAKASQAAAEQKRRAVAAREIIDRIDSLFASADTHFKQALAALNAADARIEELHQLGFPHPTAVQLRANIIFALETCLMSLPRYLWNELARGSVRFLAPGQRRTFSQFWQQMSESLSREIAARLGETKHNKEGGENVAA